MSFFEDTKKFIDFDTLSYLIGKLRDENQSTYLNGDNSVSNEDIDSIFASIPEYLKEDYNPYPNYLTMVALEDDMTVSLSNDQSYEYSIDGGEWISIPCNTETPAINTGQSISFRGGLVPNSEGVGVFYVKRSYKLTGSCMSILLKDPDHPELDDDSFYSNYDEDAAGYNGYGGSDGAIKAFYRLFHDNDTLKSVHKNFLPATTLIDYCYCEMFRDCTSLTTAPELPATELAYCCYANMFNGCASLTTAPTILPATKLAEACYQLMFFDCTSLTTAPELPATEVTNYCYDQMFRGCTSLTTAPELPATTLAEYCYQYMFSGCTSLTTAPKLPATTLAELCYNQMFYGCTSLTTAPELPATKLAEACYYCMFQKCTSLTTAPELPATTLAGSCYYHMFYNCTSLNHIKMLATDISSYDCLDSWVYNVANNGTFVKHPNMTSLPTGIDGIPEGWTVQDAA